MLKLITNYVGLAVVLAMVTMWYVNNSSASSPPPSHDNVVHMTEARAILPLTLTSTTASCGANNNEYDDEQEHASE